MRSLSIVVILVGVLSHDGFGSQKSGKDLAAELSRLFTGGELKGKFRSGEECLVSYHFKTTSGTKSVIIESTSRDANSASVGFNDRDKFNLNTDESAGTSSQTYTLTTFQTPVTRNPFFIVLKEHVRELAVSISETGKKGDMLTCRIKKAPSLSSILGNRTITCSIDTDPKINNQRVLKYYKHGQLKVKAAPANGAAIESEYFGYGDTEVYDLHIGEFVIINFGDDGRHVLVMGTQALDLLVSGEEREIPGDILSYGGFEPESGLSTDVIRVNCRLK